MSFVIPFMEIHSDRIHKSLKGLEDVSAERTARKPHRSPNKTKPRIEKQILKIRRVEPYLGPDRISNDAKKIHGLNVPPSTVFAILGRAKVVGKKIAVTLTKRHLRRNRRPLPRLEVFIIVLSPLQLKSLMAKLKILTSKMTESFSL